MLARISSRLLSEWMAYAALEPFGEARADLRMGILASVIANTQRDPKKKREPWRPEDFMPRFAVDLTPTPAAASPTGEGDGGWQRNKAIMQMLTAALSKK